MEITVASYNPDHLYSPHHLGLNENRYDQAEQIIREIDPHVLLIQEIYATNQLEAARNIGRLARATGLQCVLKEGQGEVYTVTKSNTHNLANGILWHPDLVPTGWQRLEGLWHGFGLVPFDFDGTEIAYGCYHGQPAGQHGHERGDTRPDEARQIGGLVTARGADSLTLVGGDWNSLSADRAIGSNDYYDHRTVADGVDPGFARFVMDRTAGEILRVAGLIDVAAARPGAMPINKINTEPPTAKEGARRNDIFRATKALMRLVTFYGAITPEEHPAAEDASDHYAIVLRHRLPGAA